MGNSKLVYSFFLCFISFSCSSSSSNHKCPDEQRDALLLFKQNISSTNRLDVFLDDFCEDLRNPIRLNWNTSTDCCDWVGITCNNFTGDVISLHLTCGQLKGVLELDTLLSNLPKLRAIDLSYSGLSVVTRNEAHYSYVNPDFYELSLASCKLTVFPGFLRAMKNLQILDLSRNKISGHIPSWASEIGGNDMAYLDVSDNFITGLSEFRSDRLQYLDLHTNLIQEPFPQWICKMKHLKYLDISYNDITGSVPQCLQNISFSLEFLNVQSNMIQGPFPTAICNMVNLMYLDMSYNLFHGVVPQCLQNISSSLVSLNVNSNLIHGPFPTAICNMGNLLYLDMSTNSFEGVIPHCFGNITSSLAMINLGRNKFHSIIPILHGNCGLSIGLILKGNKLEGEVPKSLFKCQSLKVLDLGNNQLNGTFPRWLGYLQKLQVLILRSNKLDGPVEASSTSAFLFPSLRVFDISNNEFVGRLPVKYFENFNAIKDVDKGPKTGRLKFNDLHYYQIDVMVKGIPLSYSTSISIMTVVDLSNNRFEGEIPNVVGNLISLKALNFSNNNLSGQIPGVLGNLFNIESLDLARNQLVGEIPQSLIHLHQLVLLNLSQNHLVGHLPERRGQFATFTDESYLGNPGLCGPPLPSDCEDLSSPQVEEHWICMEAVMLGLGCGTLLGLALGYHMLSTGRPKWFKAIADAGGHTRRQKREHLYFRRQN